MIFLRRCSKKKWPKTGKSSPCLCPGLPSQSIGRGRISREGALDIRESREQRDKIVPIFCRKTKTKEKRHFYFGLIFSTF